MSKYQASGQEILPWSKNLNSIGNAGAIKVGKPKN